MKRGKNNVLAVEYSKRFPEGVEQVASSAWNFMIPNELEGAKLHTYYANSAKSIHTLECDQIKTTSADDI